MAQQTYKVQDYALKFDGETYEAGDTLAMDEAQAAPLIEAGRLKKTAAPKAGGANKS